VTPKLASTASLEVGVSVKFLRAVRCFCVLLGVVPCSLLNPAER
jgi:hypothetical protein